VLAHAKETADADPWKAQSRLLRLSARQLRCSPSSRSACWLYLSGLVAIPLRLRGAAGRRHHGLTGGGLNQHKRGSGKRQCNGGRWEQSHSCSFCCGDDWKELPVGSLVTEPTPLPDQGSNRARRLLPSTFGTLLKQTAIGAMALPFAIMASRCTRTH
jgi:hypothetical protein